MNFTPEQLRKMAEDARRRMDKGEPVNDPSLSEPEGPVLRPELLDRDPDELEAAKERARAETERKMSEAREAAEQGRPARAPRITEVPVPQAPPPRERGLDAAADAIAGGRKCLICKGPLSGGCPVCQVCIDDKKRGDMGYGG